MLPAKNTGRTAKPEHGVVSRPWIQNNSAKSPHWADVHSTGRRVDSRQ
jgi:hypothetical protein